MTKGDHPDMNILSPVIGQGDRVYMTARLKDLIAGAKKPPASRPSVLTQEELRSSPNYLFYCRFWRSLTEAFPEAQFVRSVGLYRGASDWLKRWPAEKSGYSGLILITFPSWPGSTGETIIEYLRCPGIDLGGRYRYVAAGVAREVADIVRLGRPICLIEADDSAVAYRIVDRFILTPVLRPTKSCTAIVGQDPDASPYTPDCNAVEAALEHLKA
jgi:hypothetical protein